MNTPGYEKLADVLQRAFDQAANGKGKERHAQGEPFHEQVMQIGARKFGVGSLLFQAFKKSEESQRLPLDRGVNELLGAIVYLAGAVIAREAAEGDHPHDAVPAPEVCCGKHDTCNKPCVPRAQALAGKGGWIDWHGGDCPVPKGTPVEVMIRNGRWYKCLALESDLVGSAFGATLMWHHIPCPIDIIAYRIVEPTNG